MELRCELPARLALSCGAGLASVSLGVLGGNLDICGICVRRRNRFAVFAKPV